VTQFSCQPRREKKGEEKKKKKLEERRAIKVAGRSEKTVCPERNTIMQIASVRVRKRDAWASNITPFT
jgi:hypothetical protein